MHSTEQPKEPTIEQQLRGIRKDVAAYARALGIKPREALMLLMQRELVILNSQAARILEELGRRAKRG